MLGKEYVSRQQVEEMERLFDTAVEGLSSRLKDMEARQANPIIANVSIQVNILVILYSYSTCSRFSCEAEAPRLRIAFLSD